VGGNISVWATAKNHNLRLAAFDVHEQAEAKNRNSSAANGAENQRKQKKEALCGSIHGSYVLRP
jgi:hypothetical protein